MNLLLLKERVEYISCMNSFYHVNELLDTKKYLDVSIPNQGHMSVEECSNIFQALSKEHCLTPLCNIKMESLMYFACYYQCTFMFSYIKEIIIQDVTKLPQALKISCIYLGEFHKFTLELLRFAADLLDSDIYEILLMLRTKSKKKNTKRYVVSRLTTKIRDKARQRRLDFANVHLCCIMCKKMIIISRKLEEKVEYTACCGKPMHIDCYKRLKLSCMYFVYSRECGYCHMKWQSGSPVCQSLYLRWSRRENNGYMLKYTFDHLKLCVHDYFEMRFQ